MPDININQHADGDGNILIGYVEGNLTISRPDTPPTLLPIKPPEKLFGRDDLLQQANAMLDEGQPLLLYGPAGMGKTALAATVARDRFEADQHSGVLWLTAGRNAGLDALLNGIAIAFEKGDELAKLTEQQDRLTFVRQLVSSLTTRQDPRPPLVVIDDVWDGQACWTLLELGLPDGVPVLITSRKLVTRIRRRIEVLRLNRPDALDLLGFHAQEDYTASPAADTLCADLGDHPYAVEIAGVWLAYPDMDLPLLRRKMADAPQNLSVPEDFAMEGRENIAALLAASIADLNEETRRAFLATGRVFAPRVTPELLSNLVGQPVDDTWLTLSRRSLTRYQSETERSAPYYTLHDLTFVYARALADADDLPRAVEACVTYARGHAHEPNTPEGVAHHNALEAELPNLLGAAEWAAEHELYEAVNQLGWDLSGNSKFLDVRGRVAETMVLLPMAIEATRALFLRRDEGAHLNTLGLGYLDLGHYHKARVCFEQALSIAYETGDQREQGTVLGNLGLIYAAMGRYEKAMRYHQASLTVAQEIGNRRGEGSAFANLGIAYRQLGDNWRAIECFGESLYIAQQMGDRRGKVLALGNLGNAYFAIGNINDSQRFYLGALTLAREIGDRATEGSALGNLGLLCMEQGLFVDASVYFRDAIAIRQAIGDRYGEASETFKFAWLHVKQDKYADALESFTAARALFDEMGVAHLVERCDDAIAQVRAMMASNA